MANDETQTVLMSLLESVVARGTAPQPSGTIADIIQGLGGPGVASIAPSSSTALTDTAENSPQSGDSQGTSLLAGQLADLTRAVVSQSGSLEANTAAVLERSAANSGGGGLATVASIGKTVLSFLGGGFGLVQLFASIFGRSSEEEPVSFERYSLPSPVKLEAGLSQSPTASIYPLRYTHDGLPDVPGAISTQQPTPVTIQVQAMDSRSFMDHSGEIAQAVREALLHSHSLNDVVVEL